MGETGPAPRPRPSRRTQVIGLLKILLPALALVLLGAVVFWRQSQDIGVGLSFSEEDMVAMRSGLVINRPQLSGASVNGDLYDFRAERVVPQDLSITRADISTLSGRVEFRDAQIITLSADSAAIDLLARMVVLRSGVSVSTSDGYVARSPRVEMDVANAVLTADGPVEASGPPGEITAGGLTITRAGGNAPDGDVLMRFTGGVTLRYNPAEMGRRE